MRMSDGSEVPSLATILAGITVILACIAYSIVIGG